MSDRETFQAAIANRKKADIQPKYPPFFTFEEEGDWVRGVLSNPREIDTEFGKMKVMDITTPQGEAYSIGLTINLLPLWDFAGKEVVIHYLRKTKNEGKKGYTKHFDIYV